MNNSRYLVKNQTFLLNFLPYYLIRARSLQAKILKKYFILLYIDKNIIKCIVSHIQKINHNKEIKQYYGEKYYDKKTECFRWFPKKKRSCCYGNYGRNRIRKS